MKKQSECIHYEIINSPAPREHEIGVCRRCGRTTDYTELQQKYPLLADGTLLSRGITMDIILTGKKPRGRPSKYARHTKRSRMGIST